MEPLHNPIPPGVAGPDSPLYEQLGSLARYMDRALRQISGAVAPMSDTMAQIPQAAAHLSDLIRLTEEGTHKVMALLEAIQDNHGKVASSLADVAADIEGNAALKDASARLTDAKAALSQDDRRLMEIMTALSFQDLTAQRVKKLMRILHHVQHRLLELVVVFGLAQEEEKAPQQSEAAEMLKQLDQSKSTAIDQTLADEILAKFGFNEAVHEQ